VLAAGVGACVGVLATAGLGFTVLIVAGEGFAVTVLVTVGLGSGARTTVGADVPHAVTAAATMAIAPAASAIGFLIIALPHHPHHQPPAPAETGHTRKRADDTGTDPMKM
jgi:hypothetical protein